MRTKSQDGSWDRIPIIARQPDLLMTTQKQVVIVFLHLFNAVVYLPPWIPHCEIDVNHVSNHLLQLNLTHGKEVLGQDGIFKSERLGHFFSRLGVRKKWSKSWIFRPGKTTQDPAKGVVVVVFCWHNRGLG